MYSICNNYKYLSNYTSFFPQYFGLAFFSCQIFCFHIIYCIYSYMAAFKLLSNVNIFMTDIFGLQVVIDIL